MSMITNQLLESIKPEVSPANSIRQILGCFQMISNEFKAQMPASLTGPIESHISHLCTIVIPEIELMERRTAHQVLSGHGPIGQKLFEYIELHRTINAYPQLPDGIQYNFSGEYEEKFVFPVLTEYREESDNLTKLFNLLANLRNISKIQVAMKEMKKDSSLFSTTSESGFCNLNSNWGRSSPALYISVPPRNDRELHFIVLISLDHNNYRRELYYYHPMEKLWVEAGPFNSIILPGTHDRLKEEVDRFLEPFELQVQPLSENAFKDLKDELFELTKSFLSKEIFEFVTDDYTVAIRQLEHSKLFELTDKQNKNIVHYTFTEYEHGVSAMIQFYTSVPHTSLVAQLGNFESQIIHQQLFDALMKKNSVLNPDVISD